MANTSPSKISASLKSLFNFVHNLRNQCVYLGDFLCQWADRSNTVINRRIFIFLEHFIHAFDCDCWCIEKCRRPNAINSETVIRWLAFKAQTSADYLLSWRSAFSGHSNRNRCVHFGFRSTRSYAAFELRRSHQQFLVSMHVQCVDFTPEIRADCVHFVFTTRPSSTRSRQTARCASFTFFFCRQLESVAFFARRKQNLRTWFIE